MQQNVVTYKVTICLDVNVPGKEAGGKQKCETKMAALNSKKKIHLQLGHRNMDT